MFDGDGYGAIHTGLEGKLVDLTLKPFIAMKHGILTTMQGEVARETPKAILLTNGKGVRHDREVERVECMVCGRELTDPVSRLLGIGPFCGKKAGLTRPDNDKDVVAAAKLLKKQQTEDYYAQCKFEGWLPKSQLRGVEILGDVPTVPRPQVATTPAKTVNTPPKKKLPEPKVTRKLTDQLVIADLERVDF